MNRTRKTAPQISVEQTLEGTDAISTNYFSCQRVPCIHNFLGKALMLIIQISPLYIYFIRMASRSSVWKEGEQPQD